jgi:hypothetical protein
VRLYSSLLCCLLSHRYVQQLAWTLFSSLVSLVEIDRCKEKEIKKREMWKRKREECPISQPSTRWRLLLTKYNYSCHIYIHDSFVWRLTWTILDTLSARCLFERQLTKMTMWRTLITSVWDTCIHFTCYQPREIKSISIEWLFFLRLSYKDDICFSSSPRFDQSRCDELSNGWLGAIVFFTLVHAMNRLFFYLCHETIVN